MVNRLVLGCGAIGYDIVDTASEWGGDLTVVADDPGRVESLRSENVDAHEGDPADASAYPETADVVVLASSDGQTNLAAGRTAREHFPDALVVGYVPSGTDAGVRTDLHELSDRIIDYVDALSQRVTSLVTGDDADRLADLLDVLRDLDGPLAVVMHDNPDPDAIASAIALVGFVEHVAGVDADACYFGEISHQENRALVNLLDLSLRNVEDSATILDEYAGIALVDHSRPGVNDQLPEDVAVDIVIDHHPPREAVDARYLDLRSEVGATSTLLAEYLTQIDIEPDQTMATALLYGIRIDTKDFTREVSEADFEAAATLLPAVDLSTLERVETPSLSPEVLDTLADAIAARDVRNGVLTSCVGEINDRDTLAQAAERLLNMEGITISVVYGFMEGTVYVSSRARGTDVDLGEMLRDALGQIGSAGGHADMAGAQIPLGILADVGEESTSTLASVIEDLIADRIYDTLETAPNAPTTDYAISSYSADNTE